MGRNFEKKMTKNTRNDLIDALTFYIQQPTGSPESEEMEQIIVNQLLAKERAEQQELIRRQHHARSTRIAQIKQQLAHKLYQRQCLRQRQPSELHSVINLLRTILPIMKARQAERKPQSSSRYHDYHAIPRTKPAYIVDLLNALKKAKAQRSASLPIHHHPSSSKIQTSYIPKSEKDFAKLLEFFVDYKQHQENQQAHESKPFHNFSGASRTKSSYLKDFLSALHDTKEIQKNVAEEPTRGPTNEDFEKLLKIEELLKEKKEALIGKEDTAENENKSKQVETIQKQEENEPTVEDAKPSEKDSTQVQDQEKPAEDKEDYDYEYEYED